MTKSDGAGKDGNQAARLPEQPPERPLDRSVALIGLMGAGKSAIGRRLAARLGAPFLDSDHEIERAADCTIAEIFERFGEAGFREGEERVIARLLDGPPVVLATGGGAFMTDATRALIKDKAVTLWLKADLNLLVRRTAGRSHRPLLNKGDPRRILGDLIARRHPVYAEADVTVEVSDEAPEVTTQRVRQALEQHLGHPLPNLPATSPPPSPASP